MVWGFFDRSHKSAVAGDAKKRLGDTSRKTFFSEESVVDRLTVAQLEEFKDAFSTFDKDSSGAIDAKELRNLMASVGQNLSDEELAEMVRIADADGAQPPGLALPCLCHHQGDRPGSTGRGACMLPSHLRPLCFRRVFYIQPSARLW